MGAFTVLALYSIIYDVEQSHRKTLLPVAASAGSFISLLILTILTSPVSTISYAITFFLLLFVFLVSTAYAVIYIQNGRIRSRNRYRIYITSLLIVVAIMLRSAQSLNLMDAFILLLVAMGLLVYSSRRSG
jgi:hypothetical protein